MKDTMFALLALVFAIATAFFFYSMRAADASVMYMVLGVVFLILTVACGVMFMTKRVNKAEDIHITE